MLRTVILYNLKMCLLKKFKYFISVKKQNVQITFHSQYFLNVVI